MTAEFEIEHEGEAYWVEVTYDKAYVDDSFDCDINGRPGTHRCGHWEPDMESLEIVSCTDGDGEEVMVGPDLEQAISEHLIDMDHS